MRYGVEKAVSYTTMHKLVLHGLFVLLVATSITCNAATLPPRFAEQIVVSGFNLPIGMAFLPDGRILVVEKGGTLRLVVNETLVANPLLDISSEILSSGEQGLLGVAVDPDFPTRPYIYLFYTNASPNRQYIVRYTLSGTLNNAQSTNLTVDEASRVFLLNNIPNVATNHNGGTLRFGPDKHLYISIGDDAQNCDAQERTSLSGVILRVKIDDSIVIDNETSVADISSLAPAGNPWVMSANNNERLVWAYGLRNPYRFDIDPVTGNLAIGDVGQVSLEELDISSGGENFGWPFREGTNVRSVTCSAPTVAGVPPIFEVAHDSGPNSIVGGPIYRGKNYPADFSFPAEYDGVAFAAGFYRGYLFALEDTGSGWSPVSPLGNPDSSFGFGLVFPADMIVGPDGAIYYPSLSFSGPGDIRRIVFQPFDLNADTVVDSEDLGIFMGRWETNNSEADFDGSGTVDSADLDLMLKGL